MTMAIEQIEVHGYGLGAQGGVLTPYAGLALEGEGARTLRVGTRFALGSRASLGLEAGRREASNDAAEHRIGVTLSARW